MGIMLDEGLRGIMEDGLKGIPFSFRCIANGSHTQKHMM